MIRLSLHVAVGVVLSGCTFNNIHRTEVQFANTEVTVIKKVPSVVEATPPLVALVPSVGASATTAPTQDANTAVESMLPTDPSSGAMPKIIIGNMRIRPECAPYVPLAVPKPVQIDLKELEAAGSGREINAIALRNVRQLNVQMRDFAAAQQRHYSEYMNRCLVKK